MRCDRPLVLLACLTFPPGAFAAEPDAPPLSPEALDALERSLAADAAEAPPPAPTPPPHQGAPVQTSNPDISLILDLAGAWFSDDGRQTGEHDPTETGFHLQQLEMHLASNVDPYFRLEANLVFSAEGVEVEEAYGTTLALPANLQVRAGQFLTRFGRHNATHPHAWSFVDQPLVLGAFFGGHGSEGLGAELSWLMPLPWFIELVGSATGGEAHAHAHEGEEEAHEGEGVELRYNAALKQFFAASDEWSIGWGLSGQFDGAGDDDHVETYGTDLFVHYRPLDSTNRACVSLQVEALYRRFTDEGEGREDLGGYAQLVWTIDPEWELGGRYELLDEDATGDHQRASLAVTWYPSHFSRLRLQGARDALDGDAQPVWSSFLALELLIGAHGAHSF